MGFPVLNLPVDLGVPGWGAGLACGFGFFGDKSGGVGGVLSQAARRRVSVAVKRMGFMALILLCACDFATAKSWACAQF